MNDWFEAEQRIERAQQLSESQRFEEALAEIDVALSINPNHATWHAQRGYLLEELDRWEEAADAYEAAISLDPEDADIAGALGAALGRLGKYTKALAVFEDLAKRHPDLEPVYCHRIGIYAELGRHDAAEEMFYMAQELDEYCPHCFFAIGGSLLARGQTDRAIYCWKRVLEIEPDYIGVNRRIAQAYRAQEKLDAAKEYYLREVREDPGNTDLLFELADLSLESGELTTAAARFTQILELDPDHLESHFALGRIWLLRNQPERALSCFEAVRIATHDEPDFPGFEFKVGQALYQLGRYGEARERLELAAETDPEDVGVWMLLGDCLLMLGKPGEAADALRRLLSMDTENAQAHHKLGVALFQLGLYPSGLDHCLSAIRYKPNFGAAMLAATVGHLRLAQWREARSMLNRAMRNEPGNAELQRLTRQLWLYRLRYYARRINGQARRLICGSRD